MLIKNKIRILSSLDAWPSQLGMIGVCDILMWWLWAYVVYILSVFGVLGVHLG